MHYYPKVFLNKVIEEKDNIDNLFIVMPRRAGRNYFINQWQQMRLQLLKKLWQKFELKYFYIINHRKYMIDTTLIHKWQLQKLVKKGKFITIKEIETNLLTGNIKVAETPFYMQEMVKQYLEWKEDKNSVLNTMIR